MRHSLSLCDSNPKRERDSPARMPRGVSDLCDCRYTVALSFLIFAGTAFNLQSETIKSVMKMFVAADIKIYQPPNNEDYLDEAKLRESIENYKLQYPDHIQAYTFVTPLLSEYPQIGRPKISPLSQFPSTSLYISGIEENYLRSIYLDYYIPKQYDPGFTFPKLPNGQKDVVASLYSTHGNKNLNNSIDYYGIQTTSNVLANHSVSDFIDNEINIVLPSGVKDELSLNVNTPSLIKLGGLQFRTKIRSLVKKLPGFFFTGYRQAVFYTQAVVSMTAFRYMIDQFVERYSVNNTQNRVYYRKLLDFLEAVPDGSSYGLPKQQMMIKLAKSLSLAQREILSNNLKVNLNQDTIIIDLPSLLEKSESTLMLIQLFSIVVAVIAIVLSFFLVLVRYRCLTGPVPTPRLIIAFSLLLSLSASLPSSNENKMRHERPPLLRLMSGLACPPDVLCAICPFLGHTALSSLQPLGSLVLIVSRNTGSYISNIKENSWEFGILRSIGLNKTQITKVYIYEAFSLIISSSIIGSFIGIIVAATMTIQILMFLEINFIFLFPTIMFCTVFCLGILISIFGSYYAIKLFKDQQISQIVKGLI